MDTDDLDIPDFLKRSPDEPERPWVRLFKDHGPTLAEPTDSERVALQAEAEAQRLTRSRNRVAKMLSKKAGQAAAASGKRWNTRTGRWE